MSASAALTAWKWRNQERMTFLTAAASELPVWMDAPGGRSAVLPGLSSAFAHQRWETCVIDPRRLGVMEPSDFIWRAAEPPPRDAKRSTESLSKGPGRASGEEMG